MFNLHYGGKDDSLVVVRQGEQPSIALRDLVSIERKESAYMWGTLVGGIAGIAIGVANTEWKKSSAPGGWVWLESIFVSPLAYVAQVMIYAIGGAAVGAVIGYPLLTTEKRDFIKMSADEIKSVVKNIIE